MFKHVPQVGPRDQRPPTSAKSPTLEDDDDDNISLTSTVSSNFDSETEFEVETIRLETKPVGGKEPRYLVEWKNYPLFRCTWEPARQIGPELQQIWEEKKERQKKGEEEGWTMDDWYQIVQKAAAERSLRHRKRNARRKRLGLPLTEPVGESEDKAVSSEDSENEEAEDIISVGSVKGAASQSQALRRTSTGIAATETRPHTASTPITKPTKRTAPSEPRRPPVSRKHSLETKAGSRVERPSATGYQGTARRSSDSTLRSAGGGKNDDDRRLTAKRTGVAKTGAGNVFKSGKMPKTRQPNPAAPRQERLYMNLSALRRAELKSRNREDLAPTIPPPVALVGQTPLREKRADLESLLFSSMATPVAGPSDEESSLPVVAPGVPQMYGDGENTATESASAKRRADRLPLQRKKSVRFWPSDDVLFIEPDVKAEHMDVDPQADQGSSPSALARPGTEVETDSIVVTRTVEKKLRFGVAPEVMASFADVCSVPDDAWLAEFLNTESITMSYVFSAADFAERKDTFLWKSLLCSGALSSPSDSIFERVAINLQGSNSGLCYLGSEFNLVVYPTGCDAWKELIAQWNLPTSAGETARALGYILFRPAMDCRPFVRPARSIALSTAALAASPVSFDERIMQTLANVHYQDLLPIPNSTDEASVHHFFLIFPAAKNPWLTTIFRWLRACDPNCLIFTSHNTGSWSAFCNVLGESGSGTVIVHETMAPYLHRFPKLWTRLNDHQDVYWSLSEASQPHPLFPSLTDEVVPPGEIFLTELFPYDRRPEGTRERDEQFILKRARHVLLVTPSFLCAEPHRTWELLDWFWNFCSRDPRLRIKLVTVDNLPGYLEELAERKLREREELLDYHRNNILQGELMANLSGLSKDDCANRSKACAVARDLHYRRAKVAGPCDANEDLSTLVYAPPHFDPNDEQSLVNWFGWWSSMRMDQFRGFHVLGSSPAMRFHGSRRGVRHLPIPKFSDISINDPDMVREAVVESRNETVAVAVPQPGTSSGPTATPTADQQTSALKRKAPWAYQSKRIPSERSINGWVDRLRTIALMVKPATLVRLYWYPVSWVDSLMSWQFGDSRENFKSYMTWWNYAFGFMSNFRAYAGFFYTIADEWNSDGALPRAPERHPWVCIYRPADPQPRFVGKGSQFGECQPVEVIIWDPAARERYPGGQTIREQDLIDAQRQVIRLVRENTAEKNDRSWLKQVWYGGFKPPAEVVDPPYPIDISLQWLVELMNNPFEYIPEVNREAAMPALGFKKVHLADSPLHHHSPDQLARASTAIDMDIDAPTGSANNSDDDDDDDDEVRMIFHPPRGTLPAGEHTKCINRLYQSSVDAIATAPHDTEMMFEFVPTADWYDIQRKEGRGNEHMYVGPWEKVFNQFRIKAAES